MIQIGYWAFHARTKQQNLSAGTILIIVVNVLVNTLVHLSQMPTAGQIPVSALYRELALFVFGHRYTITDNPRKS
jgi:hypothetical protein